MKNPLFHTLQTNITTEISIQKSRFLGHAKQVENEEDALIFLHSIQKKYRDATHNCYAYRITSSIQRAHDDGEPSGTAGRPILGIIEKNNLLHTLIIVTRYFGGIKLGAGGLIRAYSRCAAEVISRAGVLTKRLHQELTLKFDYAHLSKMESMLHRGNYHIEPLIFGEEITCTIWIPVTLEDIVKQQVTDWTQGQITIQVGRIAFKDAL